MTQASTSLVVPLSVAALCVGEPDADGPPRGMLPMRDFSRLPSAARPPHQVHGAYLGRETEAGEEPFEGDTSLPAGIHLHWHLPKGLTHGLTGTGDRSIDFPNVPNRWLVSRLVVRKGAGAESLLQPVKSWVVESDRLSFTRPKSSGLTPPTVPLSPGPPARPGHAYLGAAFPLEDWSESTEAHRSEPLTALGYGEPTFAAFYPNCSTVFGFFDPFDDVSGFDPSSSSVAYHVAGWYAAPGVDPMSAGALDPLMNRFGWTFTGTSPARTLCSGLVDGIEWDPKRTYIPDADSDPRMTVSIARSLPEAAAALMADAHADHADRASVEHVLEALQLGLLSTTAAPGSAAKFEDARHRAGFEEKSAGLMWEITAEPGHEKDVTVAEPAAALLAELNSLELQADAVRRDLDAARDQLFVDWNKYTVLERGDDDAALVPLRNELFAVKQHLRSEIATIHAGLEEAAALARSIEGKVQLLRGLLDAGLILSPASAAPRFYRPNDPVLLLCGSDLARVGPRRPEPVTEMLACRLSDQVVGAVTIEAGAVPGWEATTVAAADLPRLPARPDDLPAEVEALLADAIFMGRSVQRLVVEAAARKRGGGLATSVPAALEILDAASAAFLSGAPTPAVEYSGVAPDDSLVAHWTTPWVPLLLQYDVHYRPALHVAPGPAQPASDSDDARRYPRDWVCTHFDWDDAQVDLAYQSGDLQERVQQYTGTIILTAGGTAALVRESEILAAALGDEGRELSSALEGIDELPLLSQALTGLNEAMLMRRLSLQVAVADPWGEDDQALVTEVAGAVGERNLVSPLPENSFNPLQAGSLRVMRLRLIDAFGRFRDYEQPRGVVAAALTPPARLKADDAAFLPLRITQPARLMFRWRRAEGDEPELDGALASSPVLGWVVPNYLQDAVSLYTADGSALGEVTLSVGEDAALWTPAPGGAGLTVDEPIDDVFAATNSHLRELATTLYGGGDPAFLRPFFRTVRVALTSALPASLHQEPGPALLLGQPLVLARATLSLEVSGPTASDESWSSLYKTLTSTAYPRDAGLSAVEFPVALGRLDHLDDTLVGYWIERDGVTDFAHFYSSAASEGDGAVRAPTKDTLTVSPNASGAVTVTMLLDPHGSVHAATGILPVKAIDIPPQHYRPALSALSVAFSVRPVLTGSNAVEVSLPLPRVVQGEWEWHGARGREWVRSATSSAPVEQATLAYSPQRIVDGWLTLRRPNGL
ncbi:MAG TPA: hypothetical protein VIG64_04215 [Actinomycetota bacterium]